MIAVGGCCFLLPETMSGISQIVHVPQQAVANAVGAAIAQVSGEEDRIFQNLSRDGAIAQARRLAEAKAVRAGAEPRRLDVVEGVASTTSGSAPAEGRSHPATDES